MNLSIFHDPRIDVLAQALDGLSQRQQAIAGNIANVDTPGYQRKDVTFEAALRAQFGLDAGTRLATTNPGHIPYAPGDPGLLATATNTNGSPLPVQRNDGNNVDIDYEMTLLAQTTLLYQTLAQAATNRFATLNGIVTRLT